MKWTTQWIATSHGSHLKINHRHHRDSIDSEFQEWRRNVSSFDVRGVLQIRHWFTTGWNCRLQQRNSLRQVSNSSSLHVCVSSSPSVCVSSSSFFVCDVDDWDSVVFTMMFFSLGLLFVGRLESVHVDQPFSSFRRIMMPGVQGWRQGEDDAAEWRIERYRGIRLQGEAEGLCEMRYDWGRRWNRRWRWSKKMKVEAFCRCGSANPLNEEWWISGWKNGETQMKKGEFSMGEGSKSTVEEGETYL